MASPANTTIHEEPLPTLEAFIDDALAGDPRFPRNSYVLSEGFEALYVRFTKRFINGKFYWPVLDIANVTAEKPGNHAFKTLLVNLRLRYPNLNIYVEGAQDPRFQDFFRKRDWIEVPNLYPPCFLWEA